MDSRLCPASPWFLRSADPWLLSKTGFPHPQPTVQAQGPAPGPLEGDVRAQRALDSGLAPCLQALCVRPYWASFKSQVSRSRTGRPNSETARMEQPGVQP